MQALRAEFGPLAFVRRDLKRRALFVSDIPARLQENELAALLARLKTQGWQTALRRGLLLLDWPWEGYRAFFGQLAENGASADDGLARLYARHECRFDEIMLPEARETLLLWDAGNTARLRALAGAALAVALRRKQAPPAFYPILLTRDPEKEEPRC